MRAFADKFPRVAEEETRVITVLRKGACGSLPPDQYAFVELFCEERSCDCRRVVISVFAHKARHVVATINMGFDSEDDDAGPFLDPLNPQSEYSAQLMEYFVHMINNDPNYLARLQRHYIMFKEKVEGKPYKGKPFEAPGEIERAKKDPTIPAPSESRPKVGRNEPCPCGSGKKYKKCCMNK